MEIIKRLSAQLSLPQISLVLLYFEDPAIRVIPGV